MIRSGLVEFAGALAIAIIALIAPLEVRAHDSEFSTLQLGVDAEHIAGVWEIATRDVWIAAGFDAESAPDPERLRERAPALQSLLREALRLGSAAGDCPVSVEPGFEIVTQDRSVVRVRVEAVCPAAVETLTITYGLMFDFDPRHRGYFSVQDARLTHVGVFAADQPSATVEIHQLDRWRTIADYAHEGLWHIWTGFDHLLFLLALLFAAPMVREDRAWSTRPALSSVFREGVKIVTAFTLAHSLTLSLAVLTSASLPTRIVEAAIAGSVAIAAWNNVMPFLPDRAAWMAFVFGLVHGLGFAGALAQLGLPYQARGLALLSFNGGVEVGQLAIAAVALPAVFLASRRAWYIRACLGWASLGIAWIAAVWLLERLFGLRLWPGF